MWLCGYVVNEKKKGNEISGMENNPTITRPRFLRKLRLMWGLTGRRPIPAALEKTGGGGS
jgi:hypothetical protein